MNSYPSVIGEFETMRMVLSGRSIARYGDGEFKMAGVGSGIKSQCADEKISQRLRAILDRPCGDCLIGIPNIRAVRELTPGTQKDEFWAKQKRFSNLLSERTYYSSFITRPDSAPWIDTDEYWSMVESLWRGQDVTLVRGSSKSFTAERLMEAGARSVREILAPRQHAWAEYDLLLQRIGRPRRAILCLGPTATVMAVDLCARGVHAIDFGHGGMFHKKRVAGEPMVVTPVDRQPEAVS